jgi:hypothetical protein
VFTRSLGGLPQEELGKLVRLNQRFQMLVGGGQHTHVDLDHVGTANPLDLVLLEHPEQPRIGRRQIRGGLFHSVVCRDCSADARQQAEAWSTYGPTLRFQP